MTKVKKVKKIKGDSLSSSKKKTKNKSTKIVKGKEIQLLKKNIKKIEAYLSDSKKKVKPYQKSFFSFIKKTGKSVDSKKKKIENSIKKEIKKANKSLDSVYRKYDFLEKNKKTISVAFKKELKKADKSLDSIYKKYDFIEKHKKTISFALVGILIITIASIIHIGEVRATDNEKDLLPSKEKLIQQKEENVDGKNVAIKPQPLLQGVDLEGLNYQERVPILMYHYVGPIEPTFNETRMGLNVTPEDFRAQMKWLYENGFKTLTLSQYFQGIANNQILPEKPVIITFDDGYKDVYDNAIPIMKEYSQIANLFIIVDASGPVYMNWDEIKKVSDLGFEIGSHTLTHPRLTDFSDISLRKELEDSKNILEKELGKKINFFCYPYGIFDQRVHDMVRSVGYKGAVTTGYGTNVSNSNVFEMPRLRISGSMGEEGFIWTVNSAIQ